ncbi:unnamed protein product [Phytomonas sp. Hart1]|nr:unnamed protein product [Phytomonas sp. Hart1]|eukprot:CCW71205.1 unnamed protein product [Phytomonas sp. isolate Hart1]
MQRSDKWQMTNTNESSFSETYTDGIQKPAIYKEPGLSATYTFKRPQRSSYRKRTIPRAPSLPYLSSPRGTSLAWTHPFHHHVESPKIKSGQAHLSTSNDTVPMEASLSSSDLRQRERITSRPGSFAHTYQSPEFLTPRHFRYISHLKARPPPPPLPTEKDDSPFYIPLMPASDSEERAAGEAELSQSFTSTAYANEVLAEGASLLSIPLQHVLRLIRQGFSPEEDAREASRDHFPPPQERESEGEEGEGEGPHGADLSTSFKLLPSPLASSSPRKENEEKEKKKAKESEKLRGSVYRRLFFSQRASGQPWGGDNVRESSLRTTNRRSTAAQCGICDGKREERYKMKPGTAGTISKRDPLQCLGKQLWQRKASLYELKQSPNRKDGEISGEVDSGGEDVEERPAGLSIPLERWGLNAHDEGTFAAEETRVEKAEMVDNSVSIPNYGNSTFSLTMCTQKLYPLMEGDPDCTGDDRNRAGVVNADNSMEGEIQALEGGVEQPKFFVVSNFSPIKHRWRFIQGARWYFSILHDIIRIEVHPVSESMAKVA